jgi:hypothetical protein
MFNIKQIIVTTHINQTANQQTLLFSELHKLRVYNEQTNVHLIDSLLYCSLFIAPTCFNANASSSGISYALPANWHKCVHAVLVGFFLWHEHIYVTQRTLNKSSLRMTRLALKHVLTYLLTPWSRVLLEKLTSLQLVKKLPTFYGTWRFITAFTCAHYRSLS